MEIITVEELKSKLDYNPDTGEFIWIDQNPLHRYKGKVAGCVCNNGYRHTRVGSKMYLNHKLAILYMTGEYPVYPENEVDHLNRVRDDNRFVNLRVVDRSANQRNASMRVDNTSGVKGVNKEGEKWKVTISLDGKQKTVGRYNTLDEAKTVRAEYEAQNGYMV